MSNFFRSRASIYDESPGLFLKLYRDREFHICYYCCELSAVQGVENFSIIYVLMDTSNPSFHSFCVDIMNVRDSNALQRSMTFLLVM